MTATTSDRRRILNPDKAITRPQVMTHYGPHPDDRLPERARPTVGGVVVGGVGLAVMFVSWALLWGRFIGPTVAFPVCVIIPVLAARYYRRVRFDGRSVGRTLRATVEHRVRARGRHATGWYVNGRHVPAGPRRRPRPTLAATVPVIVDSDVP